jgi:hypothetical protein
MRIYTTELAYYVLGYVEKALMKEVDGKGLIVPIESLASR